MIKVGDKAPDFVLPDTERKSVKLSDYFGKKVMIVFYPKDNTPVCTSQLCDYSNNLSEFSELNIDVIAISADTIESHKDFKIKNNLNIILLSDIDKEVCRKFGALNIFGLPKRQIVLIDENCIIKYINSIIPVLYQRKNSLLKIISESFN